ncbi:MAG: hypothetical protein HFE99_05315 [Ruminiclostridium sp.]|jgi:hypothetical protein|nr:hypothetical protein [Ruminiclostridium sp.]
MERMEKDDILRKAQERKGADELELEVERRGVALSWQIGLLVCAILWFSKIFTDQPRLDVSGLYFIMVSVPGLYRWHRLRSKKELAWASVGMVIGCFSIAVYLWKLFF